MADCGVQTSVPRGYTPIVSDFQAGILRSQSETMSCDADLEEISTTRPVYASRKRRLAEMQAGTSQLQDDRSYACEGPKPLLSSSRIGVSRRRQSSKTVQGTSNPTIVQSHVLQESNGHGYTNRSPPTDSPATATHHAECQMRTDATSNMSQTRSARQHIPASSFVTTPPHPVSQETTVIDFSHPSTTTPLCPGTSNNSRSTNLRTGVICCITYTFSKQPTTEAEDKPVTQASKREKYEKRNTTSLITWYVPKP